LGSQLCSFTAGFREPPSLDEQYGHRRQETHGEAE
jgi:hypothetical protein